MSRETPFRLRADAQRQLTDLYRREGALRPADVVDAARPEEAPLHSRFTWDDTEAAEKYRLEEARKVIRVAVVTIPHLSNKPVRQFVSVSSKRRDERRGSYVAVVDLVKDRDGYEQARRDALDELLHLEKRYRHIVELAPVWGAINEAAARVAQAGAYRPREAEGAGARAQAAGARLRTRA